MRTASVVLVGVLLGALTVMTAAATANAETDPRIEAYEKQLERMQRQIDELRARLKAIESERAAAPAPAAPAAAAPAAAPSTPATTSAAAAEQDRKIGVLATEVERLKSSLTLPPTKE